MATLFFNRVMFRATSGGLGDFVVSAAITGYRTPLDASIPDNTIVSYTAESDDKTEWETGQGTYATGTVTLDRTTVYESTNANALVNFTAAPKVWIDWFAQNVAGDSSATQILFNAGTTPPSVMGDADFYFDTTADLLVLKGTGNRFIVNNNAAVTGLAGSARVQVNDFSGSNSLLDLFGWTNGSTLGPNITVAMSRSGTFGTQQIVSSGDFLSRMTFMGSDGVSFVQAARIVAIVDGAPGVGSMPGRLEFRTTPSGGGVAISRVWIRQDGTTNYFFRFLETEVNLVDAANVTLQASLGNTFKLVATAARQIDAPTDKPASGDVQKIVITHEASGGSFLLTLQTGVAGGFRYGTDITGLTTTTIGTTDYIGCIYNDAADRWDVVSYVKGF